MKIRLIVLENGAAAEEITMTRISQALNSPGQHFVTFGMGLREHYSSVLCTKATAILWKITNVFVGLLSHLCKMVTRQVGFLLLNQRFVACVFLVILKQAIL